MAKSFENDTLIFPKSSASVSLDIFVRCYYGILKHTYKHFISVKGFYWQLHEVDAKRQYLQSWLFFFKTSAIRPGMLSINFWATSWLMAAHSCISNAWSLSGFVGFSLSACLLRIGHKFSMGLRSGEFSDHGPQKIDALFPEPLSYHFSFMARCSIMLEKALFVTKLFLDGWEKLL